MNSQMNTYVIINISPLYSIPAIPCDS